jgi:membrane-associated phospholipid phosphatase
MLLSAFAGLILFLTCGYHGGFARLNGLAASVPDWIWQWLTVLGDERVAFALTLFFTRRYPRVFWTLVAAALVGIVFVHSLKPLISALRPPGVLDADTFNLIGPAHRKVSFPSGHTVTATIFFSVWTYYVRSNWLRAVLTTVAVVAGLSRVAVGVHWPVDVAAGLAGGAMASWLGTALARKEERWGACRSVHLSLVLLGGGMAMSLLFFDGGYGGAAAVQRFLGIASLAFATFVYLVEPLLRRRSLRRAGG